MKTLSFKLLALAFSSALAVPVTLVSAADKTVPHAVVSGEKIDSGLGDMPHYRTWSDPSGKNPTRKSQQMAGQKIDSGLGDLPHYRLWADPSGKAPVAPAVVLAGGAAR